MKPVLFSGSEILIKILLYEKINYIFGYPGGAIMPIYDILYFYSKKICHILTRHEQGAIHAAQGYARSTGKIGICFVTSGPGATNIITGLADSFIDSTPIICITGQVNSNLLGSDSFQEINILDISLPITKWSIQINKVQNICKNICKAFYIAKYMRPGPILIDITKDAQNKTTIFNYSKYKKIKKFSFFLKKKEKRKIKKIYNIIENSNKPLILIGQGIILSNAEKHLKFFLKKTKIPFASTLLGLGIIKNENKLYMGMLGMHGNFAPNILTNSCDLIISIGMRFDDRVIGNINKYAKQAKIIHIEIDPSEIKKNILCDIFIIGDCKLILSYLNKKINFFIKKNKWIKKFNLLKKIEEKKINKKYFFSLKKEITMYEVINYVNKYKNKNSILITDVGQHQMIASKYFHFSSIKSQITSGGLGTMGFALPASIGAQLGSKNRQIICIVGDGGIQMTIQELGTISQNQIPIKIILLNNNYLGMVRQWQEIFFKKRYSFTKLINPNFIKLANAYGINAKKETKKNMLKYSIKKFFLKKKSFLLEILVEKKDNVFPMIPSGYYVEKILLKK